MTEPRPTEQAPSGRPIGVWFGVDVGAVRVGVARSDPRATLAVPLVTLARDVRRKTDLDQLTALIADFEAVGVVVGLPRGLDGREGLAAAAARAYGQSLASRIPDTPVRYSDERMTTVIAQRSLSQNGVRSIARKAVVDQAAAVVILQSFLDHARMAES